MIWMGNDLSLINDWETYLKGIHLQHGMGSLLRWTGAHEQRHVLPVTSVHPDASLRERVWDVAEVPESIPLSPLLPQGNGMRSAVDSSPPSVSLCSLLLYFSLYCSPSLFSNPGVLSVFPTAQLSRDGRWLIAASIWRMWAEKKSMRQREKFLPIFSILILINNAILALTPTRFS